MAENDPKCMSFKSAKIIEYNLKGLKMIQNPSKAWAIVYAKIIEYNLTGLKMTLI